MKRSWLALAFLGLMISWSLFAQEGGSWKTARHPSSSKDIMTPCVCIQSNYNGGDPTQNVRVCVATADDADGTGGGSTWIGDFVEGDLTGRDLLYDFRHDVGGVDPGAPRPWSSWVAFNIDGVIYNIRGLTGTFVPTLTTPPYSVGDTIWTVWQAGDIRITQKLSPRQISGPGSATILYEYFMENTGTVSHNVGLLIEFDTMINGNDATRISTYYGFEDHEQEFLAPDIPSYWRAWENDDLSGMVAQGDILGPESTIPDRICLGSWPTYYNVVWDYTPTFGTYGDSAVLLWWYPVSIPPGGTLRQATYYGLGAEITSEGELELNLNPIMISCARCGELSPNPIDVTLLVRNTYYTLWPFDDETAYNVQATITYDASCLTLVSGANPQYTDPRDLCSSEDPFCLDPSVGSASWRFELNRDCMGTNTCIHIDVTTTSPDIDGNSIDYCFDIPYCEGSPPVAEVVRPDPCGGITSCEYQDIIINISPGMAPIIESSIILQVNGINYTTSDPQLTWSPPELHFIPSTPWTNGSWVTFSLISAEDDSGCVANIVTCNFQVDIEPPIFDNAYPPMDTVVHTPTPVIGVDIFDAISGLDPSSIVDSNIQVSVNGTVISGYSFTFDGMHIEITGVSFSNGDTVEVCILHAWDSPTYDYCAPNDTSFCWTFYVALAGPALEIVIPQPDSITACDDQYIELFIHPVAAPIDESSIDFSITVNGEPFTVDPRWVSFHDDSILTITPPTGTWHNGDTVCVTVNNVEDIYHTPSDDCPLTWCFLVDLNPPDIWGEFPADTNVTTPNPVIHISIFDSISGLYEPSVVFTINDTLSFTLSDSVFVLDPTTGEYICETVRNGITFADGETVTVCVQQAWDTPDYCDSNRIEPYCWSFTVNFIGPTAEIVRPEPDIISACDDQEIIIRVYDASGIDSSSIVLNVNGTIYTISSPYLTLDGDTLIIFQPPAGFFSDSEVVLVLLDSLADVWGNISPDTPLSWSFLVDTHPPAIYGNFPPDGAIVPDATPDIGVSIVDSVSGLSTDSVYITINDTLIFHIGDVGVDWDGENLVVHPEEAGFVFADSDTVVVCVHNAQDSPTPGYCEPNVAEEFCFSFVVSLSGPRPTIIQYMPESFVACVDTEQVLFMTIIDPDGVDPASIIFTVGDDTFTVASWELDFVNDTLIFIPSEYWTDGETVYVCLVDARDSLGNPMGSPLCWRFLIDLTPPVIWNELPSPDTLINDSLAIISFHIADSISGLDSLSVTITIDDTIVLTPGSPGVVWGDSITFDPELLGIYWNDWDTVDVCVTADDSPDYCGPNTLDSCWRFFVHLRGPVAEIVTPLPGQIAACDSQAIIIALSDDDVGVDSTTLEVIINGSTFHLDDLGIRFSGDTLYFYPYEAGWAWLDSQLVEVELVRADDNLGNPLQTPLAWDFWVDLSPPVVSDATIGPGDTVSTPTPVLCFNLTDNLSGVDETTIEVVLNDTIVLYPGSPGLSGTFPHFCIWADSIGLYVPGGDSVRICIRADDSPDICLPANHLDSCWTFHIEPGGPVATIVRPFDGAYSACIDTEHIEMIVSDEDGVVTSSIRMWVLRSTDMTDTTFIDYTTSGFSFDGENLIYYPTEPFVNAETIYVCLTDAEDIIGNPLDPSPVCWSFVMDTTPPRVWNITPPPGDVVATRTPTISMNLWDDLSGLDITGIILTINGTDYTLSDPSLTLTDSALVWDPTTAGVLFTGGDTVDVCLSAYDTPDYCGPNLLDSCWTFYIEPGGPVATIVRPFDGAHSACEDEHIVIYLTDPTGVNDSTIVLVVNDDTIGILDPRLTYEDSVLIFIPDPYFGDAETVTVELVSADDILGNPLETPLSWTFVMDRIPPEITDLSPAPEDVVVSTRPIISVILHETISWLNLDSLFFLINGDTFALDSPGVSLIEDTLFSVDCGIAGIVFGGGDTVDVCVVAYDSVDYCDPNSSDSCWTFYISPGGPIGTIIRPFDGAYSACEDTEHIEMTIEDEDSVIDETIRLMVARNGCRDTAYYEVTDPELDFTYPDLRFEPNPPFVDAETVCVALIAADDSLGNHLTSVVSWSFVMDLTPPVILIQSPLPGSYIDEREPIICVQITDSLSGINEAGITLTVAGHPYHIGDAGISWDGETICFDPAVVGTSFVGGDTIPVCIYSEDTPDYCDPNVLDSCWAFYISPGGPIPTILRPFDGAISSCPDESVAVSIVDPNGVDESTIILQVRGTDLTISDDELDFIDDSILVFHPEPPFGEAETVDVCLIEAEDNLGNPLTGAPLCWSFVVDIEPPYITDASPAPAETVSTTQPVIRFVLSDSVSGVDTSAVTLTIGGITYHLYDPGVSISGDTITFDPATAGVEWFGGTEVVVQVQAEDSPDTIYINPHTLDTTYYCSPNILDSIYSFIISPGGPVATVIRPLNETFTACIDESIAVVLRDPDGVNPETVVLTVNGATFRVGDAQITFIGDTLLIYHPDGGFADNETISVCLTHADDNLGNPLTGAPVCWQFYTDFTPPYAEMRIPTPEMMVRSDQQRIEIYVYDLMSGADVGEFVLHVAGREYHYPDFDFQPTSDSLGGLLIFNPPAVGVSFGSGDTVEVQLSVYDTPDYCDPNNDEYFWFFTIEPRVSCLVHPNPFSPNGDGYNEFVVFSYPFMFSKEGRIRVYNLRNMLIWECTVPPQTGFSNFLDRCWNGRDKHNKPVPEGLYIYAIEVEGEIVCNGTITLIR